MLPSTEPLLTIRDLTVTFPQRHAPALRAVDRVTLEINEAETVALLGESGSGKSTIGNAILGLAPVASGSVRLRDRDLTGTHSADRAYRARHVQVVFQDPYGSLNPSRTIGETLVEPLMVQQTLGRAQMRVAVADMLGQVGLPAASAARFPANFSGGQRQRIAIARAMITAPALVVCDEPVSGLDLSVQAQVLNLLADIQRRHQVAYLFISHDIAVVRRIADRVVVLYHGRVVETGSAIQVCDQPRHPYTRALFLAAPVADPVEQRARRAARLQWSAAERVPTDQEAAATDTACPFVSRCPFAIARCVVEEPVLRQTDSGSLAACHRTEDIAALAQIVTQRPSGPGGTHHDPS